MIASLLSTAYFNVFLLRATGSSEALARYNLLLACFQPIVMLAALSVLRHTSVNICQRVGLALHALAYLWLALSNESSESMVYIISGIFSAGNAFYYTSYTPQILAYTQDETRDTAYGAMGFMSTLGNLSLPLITGFFISAFGDLVGYRFLFAASSIILTSGILFSFRLPQIRNTRDGVRGQMMRVTTRMLKNREMLGMLLITTLNAAEVSGKAYYGSVLVYSLLKEEALIGTVTTVGACISLLANLVYSRLIKIENRGKGMMLGALLMLLATLLLNVNPTGAIYVVYFLIYSWAQFFVATPVVTEYMSILQQDDFLNQHGAEVHVCREFFYACGRGLGLLPAFVIPASVESSAALLILISMIQVLSALLMLWMQRRK